MHDLAGPIDPPQPARVALTLVAEDRRLLTAIATLTAFLYNLAAALLGGIEVTLAEDEK